MSVNTFYCIKNPRRLIQSLFFAVGWRTSWSGLFVKQFVFSTATNIRTVESTMHIVYFVTNLCFYILFVLKNVYPYNNMLCYKFHRPAFVCNILMIWLPTTLSYMLVEFSTIVFIIFYILSLALWIELHKSCYNESPLSYWNFSDFVN